MKIDLRKNPYRGIIVEIARELGVVEGSVRYGLKSRNAKICDLFVKKVNERKEKIERFEKLLGEVA